MQTGCRAAVFLDSGESEIASHRFYSAVPMPDIDKVLKHWSVT